ncbi:macrophage mannose receptor 1-like [Cottoperca gobio]|uniref:Macrophage mannose receptor 1-like n=1 Tax=Cottoperca gobio TaxID=56716 RepID=A0A6J2Q9S8_COTGO|nr:macrophage mannose receptor 1-like [Cottoperca gobio]
MERTIFLLVLLTAVEGDIGKHIFVHERMTWPEAQTYCRKHYTDLSYVGSQSDVDGLLQAAGANRVRGWIGLHRDLGNITGWKWSGGGHITFQNWERREPNNLNKKETAVVLDTNGKWIDVPEIKNFHFYCINITAVEEKKSWEGALEYCRENYTDLPSLLTETELLLATEGIQKDHISDRVWIGLRYLGDRWLWVNGEPLEYKAWPQGGDRDHQCPIRKRCGALTKEGVWENWDCWDKLNFICI